MGALTIFGGLEAATLRWVGGSPDFGLVLVADLRARLCPVGLGGEALRSRCVGVASGGPEAAGVSWDPSLRFGVWLGQGGGFFAPDLGAGIRAFTRPRSY